jgi:hypothetical protein
MKRDTAVKGYDSHIVDNCGKGGCGTFATEVEATAVKVISQPFLRQYCFSALQLILTTNFLFCAAAYKYVFCCSLRYK